MRFNLQILLLHLLFLSHIINPAMMLAGTGDNFTLDSVRDALIRQEDTIVFTLIQRAKYPINSPAYHSGIGILGFSASIAEFVVQQTEGIQSKSGRYLNPEELPFFPENLPPSALVSPPKYPQKLHPAGASININKRIWDFYFKELLPMFVVEGNDGNYLPTIASDLDCLQAISRRIHYGRFVAEVKYSAAPADYTPAIHAKDGAGLMKLVTFESVEETVKRRVEKKGMVFGQEVSLEDDNNKQSDSSSKKYKIEPSVFSKLYGNWVMPLTKDVQVQYLLLRLS